MCEYLPYDDIKLNSINKLKEILNTSDDSEYGYYTECDLRYPEEKKEKTKYFPYCPENKFSPQNKYTEYMNDMKTDSYTSCKKIICDWTDRKNYFIHYRMLKFYVKHGMIVDKVHEVISFIQKAWLKVYIDFNTKKELWQKMNSKKIYQNV